MTQDQCTHLSGNWIAKSDGPMAQALYCAKCNHPLQEILIEFHQRLGTLFGPAFPLEERSDKTPPKGGAEVIKDEIDAQILFELECTSRGVVPVPKNQIAQLIVRLLNTSTKVDEDMAFVLADRFKDLFPEEDPDVTCD